MSMGNKKTEHANTKWIAAVMIYVILLIVCIIAVYAVPSVKGMLEKTYIAEYGRIDVKDEVSAFIVRDETVYVAAEACRINRLAEPGKLVKAGTKIVELTPEESPEFSSGTNVKGDESGSAEEKSKYSGVIDDLGKSVVVTDDGRTKSAGYVSYYVDGAEAALSTGELADLRYKDYKALSSKKSIATPEKKCGTGYPLFRITDNRKWYLVYYISNEDAAKYTEGDTVDIDINGEPVTVTVSGIEEGRRESKITLLCKSFFDGFLDERTLDTTVTLISAEGLVIEDASIVEAPDGRRGVFVKNKLGRHIFKPVRAKADDGTKCVVYSDIYVDEGGNYVETVGTYDEIIAEPSEEDIASLSKPKDTEKAGKDDARAGSDDAGADKDGAKAGKDDAGADKDDAKAGKDDAGADKDAA